MRKKILSNSTSILIVVVLVAFIPFSEGCGKKDQELDVYWKLKGMSLMIEGMMLSNIDANNAYYAGEITEDEFRKRINKQEANWLVIGPSVDVPLEEDIKNDHLRSALKNLEEAKDLVSDITIFMRLYNFEKLCNETLMPSGIEVQVGEDGTARFFKEGTELTYFDILAEYERLIKEQLQNAENNLLNFDI